MRDFQQQQLNDVSVHDESVPKPTGTMTSSSVIPPAPEPRVRRGMADELSADIVARPLVMPDFIHVEPAPLAKGLSFRWIFNDQRRVSQCLAQGWRIAKKTDIKDGQLSPYRQGDTGDAKFINGDLILMCIDRRLYLGALKYKHEVAARYSDPTIQATMAARSAAQALANAGAGRLGRDALGQPKMVAFAPDGADLSELPSAKEQSRITGDAGGPEILNR